MAATVDSASAHLSRVRTLVLRHGWNATAYQIINPGITHWFHPTLDAVIGYVPAPGYRVVAGAPVCAEADLAEVSAAFESESTAADRGVCYFGAESRLEGVLRDSPNHSRVLLGAQPCFAPADWPEMIGSHSSLRAQLSRAQNKEVQVSEFPATSIQSLPAIQGCLLEWLANRGLPPLHFLVEPDTLSRLFDRRLFVAQRRSEVVAFLIASPIPQRRGWLIEQMIRGRKAPNGTNELLLDHAVRTFAREGSAFVTLGLSPISRQVDMRLAENPLWLRWLLGWMRAHGRRFYNFEGLDAFKSKFRPTRWDPIYTICNQPSFTPMALYAIASAFTGGRPFRTGFRALAQAFAREVGWR